MKRQVQTALGCVAIACALLAVLYYQGFISSPERSPLPSSQVMYDGKPAAYWISRLRSEDPVLRAQAVSALDAIGGDDDRVVAALLEASQDAYAEVRINAIAAMDKIGKQPEAVL